MGKFSSSVANASRGMRCPRRGSYLIPTALLQRKRAGSLPLVRHRFHLRRFPLGILLQHQLSLDIKLLRLVDSISRPTGSHPGAIVVIHIPPVLGGGQSWIDVVVAPDRVHDARKQNPGDQVGVETLELRLLEAREPFGNGRGAGADWRELEGVAGLV